jgi:hypothetical protein
MFVSTEEVSEWRIIKDESDRAVVVVGGGSTKNENSARDKECERQQERQQCERQRVLNDL